MLNSSGQIMCARCGRWVTPGETHVCFIDTSTDATLQLPPPTTEPSIEHRIAELEARVAELRKSVQKFMKA